VLVKRPGREPTVAVNPHLPADRDQAFRDYCRAKDVSPSGLLRELVLAHLARPPAPGVPPEGDAAAFGEDPSPVPRRGGYRLPRADFVALRLRAALSRRGLATELRAALAPAFREIDRIAAAPART
jgi:hypothetical protein